MKSGLADQAANRKENKRDGAAVRQRVIAHLGRAHELAASGALASVIRFGRQVEGRHVGRGPSGSADRRHSRPCVLLLRGSEHNLFPRYRYALHAKVREYWRSRDPCRLKEVAR